MSEASVTRKYTYGYDLYSNNVHQYPSVTDVKATKNAIAGNIRDYLTHLEAFHVSTSWERGELLAYSLLSGAIVLGCAIFLARDVLLPYGVLTSVLIGMTGAAVLGACVCERLQKSDTVAFMGTCSATAEGKEYLRNLKGKRICFRLCDVPNSPIISMEAQVVGPSRLFGAPEVNFASSKLVPYGRYFTKSGYFFPPTLISDVDSLLTSLSASTSKKRR